jgi:hypothetical protein
MFAVLGAAGVGLVTAVVGTFVARSALLDAAAWVQHTSEVEPTIADCRLHLRDARLDGERSTSAAAAVAAAEGVQRLTVDNPAQQARVAELLAPLRLDQGEAGAADVRSARLVRATTIGWLVLYVSAGLTFTMSALFIAMLARQSRALALSQANATQKSPLLTSVIESMVDGVMAISADRGVLHFNRAAPAAPRRPVPRRRVSQGLARPHRVQLRARDAHEAGRRSAGPRRHRQEH